MSEHLTTMQIVNVFCNMTGASMNGNQREALSRLLQEISETGYQAGKKELGSILQCAHCGVEGAHQALQIKTLTYFADEEDIYCKHCTAKAIKVAKVAKEDQYRRQYGGLEVAKEERGASTLDSNTDILDPRS